MPAPAPMIGLPASTCARRRASASARVTRAAWISSCSRSAIAVANAGSLTFSLALVQLDPARQRLLQAGDERIVGFRVVERLAGDVDHRHAAQRDEHRDRAGAAESLRPIVRPSSAHSSGVVRISVTVGLWT